MLRQRQRKTIEELYGGKFETPKSQVMVTHRSSAQKTGRMNERDNGYLMCSDTPLSGAELPNPSVAFQKSLNSGKESARRKSARPSNKILLEKQGTKENFIAEEGKRSPIMQTLKGEKFTVYDNKTGGNYKEHQPSHQHQHRNRNHTHRSNDHDEDKDDDSDEFFELIRRTVEGAIGKSISELLNRNFRELSSKVDRFSTELKNTNSTLSQLHNEMNSKIGHYGEENSRHFRYLCMKSEYDKMFYQHQTLIATNKPVPNTEIPAEIKKSHRRKMSPKTSKGSVKAQRKETDNVHDKDSCPCLSKKCKSPVPELKVKRSPSSDISQKSSEVGMREVLEHIHQFCNQMQLNDFKDTSNNEGMGTSQQRNGMRPDNLIAINPEAFAEEDEFDEEENDEWDISSDGMTPRNGYSEAHSSHGATTSRGGGTTQRGNNGAGDG